MVTSLRLYHSPIFLERVCFRLWLYGNPEEYVSHWEHQKSVEQIKDPRLISANDGYFPESDVMKENSEVSKYFLLLIWAQLQKKKQS